jgi:leader peptidase (prepilin peptidase) / N-methyltransferase
MNDFLLLNLWFVLVFVFIFGTIVGSFLNVVILRFNTGKPIANDRSRCMSCGKNLTWLNMIPIFSWILQSGKCTNCKSKISIQYPLVEFATGLIFILIYFFVANLNLTSLTYFWPIFIYWAIVFSLLIAIFVYDLRHKIIPDEFSYSLIVLGVVGYVLAFLFNNQIYEFWWQNLILIFTFPEILNLLIGPIFFFLIFAIWFLSQGRAIGFGDAKLLLGFGFLLGFVGTVNAVLIGVWLGAIVGVILMLISKLKILHKHITIKSEIPFGPFLILGFALALFLKIDLMNLEFLINIL